MNLTISTVAIEMMSVERELNEENHIDQMGFDVLTEENRLQRVHYHQQCTENIWTDLSD